MQVDVAILTVIPEELEWTRRAFRIKTPPRKSEAGSNYWRFTLNSKPTGRRYDAVLGVIGHAGNYDCAAAVSELIYEYHPSLIVLVGIAAGDSGGG